MDLLHTFLMQKCRFDGRDFTFSTFKKTWKHHRMNYIFLIKHKQEPLSHFMRECNEYLTNRIYYNVIQHKLSHADYQLSTYCIYILYVLITQQPCFEDNCPANYIYLPEYTWNSLKSLIDYTEQHNLKDLNTILQHMIKNNYFIYCMEHPITYSTSKTDPYSKDGKIYCHGTRSRIVLTPTDLVSVMDLPMLASHRNKYKTALEQCGSDFIDKNDYNNNNTDAFIEQLRGIRSTYQQQLTKIQKTRINSHQQLHGIKYPLKFQEPPMLDNMALQKYYRCCNGYKAAMDVFTLDKAAKVANEIGDGTKNDAPQLVFDGENHPIPFIPPDMFKLEMDGDNNDNNNHNHNNGLLLPSLNGLNLPPFPVGTLNADGIMEFNAMGNTTNNNHNTKDKQFAQIFGHGEDDDVWGHTSSEDEGGMDKGDKGNKKEEQEKEIMEIDNSGDDGDDKEEEKAMDEEELERLKQRRAMYEVSQKNNRDTLDILRGLEAMEESVIGKKLESSTIEKLDINWKTHRKQQQMEKKRKKGNGRDNGKGRGKRRRGKGRGRGRRQTGKRKKVMDMDETSSSDIDFDNNEGGVFSHLEQNIVNNGNNNNTNKKSIEELEKELGMDVASKKDTLSHDIGSVSVANMDNIEGIDQENVDDAADGMDGKDVDVLMPQDNINDSNINDGNDHISADTQALLKQLEAFSQTL